MYRSSICIYWTGLYEKQLSHILECRVPSQQRADTGHRPWRRSGTLFSKTFPFWADCDWKSILLTQPFLFLPLFRFFLWISRKTPRLSLRFPLTAARYTYIRCWTLLLPGNTHHSATPSRRQYYGRCGVNCEVRRRRWRWRCVFPVIRAESCHERRLPGPAASASCLFEETPLRCSSRAYCQSEDSQTLGRPDGRPDVLPPSR